MQNKTQTSKRGFYIALAAAVLFIAALRTFIVDWTVVNGNSMLPAFSHGELALSEKISKLSGNLSRGNVIIAVFPNGVRCIKRIIAVGGDVIAIKDGELIINGKKIDEPYINERMLTSLKQTAVPENTVFVMGDNRNYSLDSREPSVGFISNEHILGKVFCVVYPIKYIRLV